MPLNMNTSFKRRVLRKRSEKCTWKTHFDGCAREVAGCLELLANNRPDRFVFARASAIKAICDKKGKHKYSKRMIEDVLRLFRDLKILGPYVEIQIELDVWRSGRFFNPHETMTRRYEGCCVFVGGTKNPGTWTIDGIWQPDDADKFGLVVEATPNTTPDATPLTEPIVDAIVDGVVHAIVEPIVDGVVHPIVDDSAKSCGDGRGAETVDLLGFEKDTDEAQKESDDDSGSEPPKPVEPTETSKPLQPPQPRKLREWVSWSWLSALNYLSEENRSDEKLSLLALRRSPSLKGSPSPQSCPPGWRPGESPDVSVIENMIANEGGDQNGETFVLLAWCEFCFNFKHDPTTKYPVTVFEANYETFRQAASDTISRVRKEKQERGEAWRAVTMAFRTAMEAREKFLQR